MRIPICCDTTDKIVDFINEKSYIKVIKVIVDIHLEDELNKKFILFACDIYNSIMLCSCCIYEQDLFINTYYIDEFIRLIDSGACKPKIVESFNNSVYSKSLRLL